MANLSPAGNWRGSALKQLAGYLALVLGVLLVLFFRSLSPTQVLFANDGPLGANSAAFAAYPAVFSGVWVDLNWLGNGGGGAPATVTNLLLWWLRPLGFAKFGGPITILILG